MPLQCQIVSLPKPVYSIAVRPRDGCCGGKSDLQILALCENEFRELLPSRNSDEPHSFILSEERYGGALEDAQDAVFERSSGSILFTMDSKAIMRFDRTNAVRLVAGSEEEVGDVDGRGETARFRDIQALAADGKGKIYVAEPNRIRVLDVSTGEVTTLKDSKPQGTFIWVALTYDAAADVLVAATGSAVCHFPLSGGQQAAAAAAGPRLVPGDRGERGRADGHGAVAEFNAIVAILAGAGGRLYIADSYPGVLRVMDPSGTVSTLCNLVIPDNRLLHMAFLPGAQLAISGHDKDEDRLPSITIISGDNYAPSNDALAGFVHSPSPSPSPRSVTKQLPSLLRMPIAPDGAGSSTTNTLVTIRAGGDVAFTAHGSVLEARSEFFRRRLARDGGFRDSGSAEVSLLDADPDVLGPLLGYLYTGELHVPAGLLQTAVELADQLLLPAECSSQLQEQLRAATSPATVVSNLCWAERRGLRELVSYLKSYLLQHRKEVMAQGGLAALKEIPDLAVELLQKAFSV